MYSTCLFCNKDLGRNQVLETLPIGRRIAFDPAEGRLWVVCRHCAKWNLVPFDTRLETIDACERMFRDARQRFSTDNIGLARVGDGLDLVRIGDALRPEFASWRYGAQYRRRRRTALAVGAVGLGATGAGLAALGAVGVSFASFGYLGFQMLQRGWNFGLNRRARFLVNDPADDSPLRVERWMSRRAVLAWDGGAPTLEVPVPDDRGKELRVARWGTADVRSVGRRVTGGLNVLLGRGRDIDRAVALLAERQGDLTAWLAESADRQREDGEQARTDKDDKWEEKGWNLAPLWRDYTHRFLILERLPASERLAIELWLNEDIERTWLAGELSLLEREWRVAENLAKIADDLAVPADVVEQVERLPRDTGLA
jgi:hypothetical protein